MSSNVAFPLASPANELEADEDMMCREDDDAIESLSGGSPIVGNASGGPGAGGVIGGGQVAASTAADTGVDEKGVPRISGPGGSVSAAGTAAGEGAEEGGRSDARASGEGAAAAGGGGEGGDGSATALASPRGGGRKAVAGSSPRGAVKSPTAANGGALGEPQVKAEEADADGAAEEAAAAAAAVTAAAAEVGGGASVGVLPSSSKPKPKLYLPALLVLGRDEDGNDSSAAQCEATRREAFNRRIKLLQEEKARIRDGTHPEIRRKVPKLLAGKEQRLKKSKAHLQFQLANIESLFQYEMEEVGATFDSSREAVRDKVISEMSSEVKKLENARDGVKEESRVGTRSLRSKAKDGDPYQYPDAIPGLTTKPTKGKTSPLPMAVIDKELDVDEIEADIDSIKAMGALGSGGGMGKQKGLVEDGYGKGFAAVGAAASLAAAAADPASAGSSPGGSPAGVREKGIKRKTMSRVSL